MCSCVCPFLFRRTISCPISASCAVVPRLLHLMSFPPPPLFSVSFPARPVRDHFPWVDSFFFSCLLFFFPHAVFATSFEGPLSLFNLSHVRCPSEVRPRHLGLASVFFFFVPAKRELVSSRNGCTSDYCFFRSLYVFLFGAS